MRSVCFSARTRKITNSGRFAYGSMNHGACPVARGNGPDAGIPGGNPSCHTSLHLQKWSGLERPFDGLCCADYTRIARVFMALTHIKLNIANPARPKRAVELGFLVDSRAVDSV